MRIVFMGTPEFACPSLRGIVASEHEVALVVSQPNRAKGRGKKVQPTPVAALAQELGLPVCALEKGKASRLELYDRVLQLEPDVIVVVAFGHIIREPLLDAPPWGCLNVHASALPRWRGPAPIHRAIVAGDESTGVCTMRLERGVDTGPVYKCATTPIGPGETAGELHDRLAELGATLLVATLDEMQRGVAQARPQDSEGATHAPMLSKAEGSCDFSFSASHVHDRIRGLFPWPAVSVLRGDERLKLVTSEIDPDTFAQAEATPGTIVAIDDNAVVVQCGKGRLRLLELQPPGKRAMPAADFARGYHLATGEMFRPLIDFAPV